MITQGMTDRAALVKNYLDSHSNIYMSYESLDDYPRDLTGKSRNNGKRGVIGFVAWRIAPVSTCDVFIVTNKNNANERYALSVLKTLGINDNLVYRILLLGLLDDIDMFGDITVVVTRKESSDAKSFEVLMEETDVYKFN